MNKLRVFLSSRVNSSFEGLDKPFSLSDLRQFIREELESETFLGEKVLDVIINEESFNGDMSKDAFDICMNTMRSCHIIIIIYNGEAGWAITDHANGICHEEFLIAMNEFSGMTYAMSLSDFFTLPRTEPEKEKNDSFTLNITSSFRHMEKISASNVEELQKTVLKQVKGYILDAVQKSFETRKEEVAGSNVFGETLDWSKLNYSERQDAIFSILKPTFSSIPGLDAVIKAFHAIPDNMSVADARNMIGRPFIEEHELIRRRKEKMGVIHFVAIYGNTTETQVKNHVGYPNLTVIKGPFGYYLWEKNSHIQMFFLIKCINPQTIKTRLSQIMNWLNGSAELPKIVVRAKARFSILHAINLAHEIKGLK
jgi:hypothetical protein